MSSHRDVIERIKKLLRLAESDNPGEAAAALRQAQRMMHRHRIEQAQLDEPDPEEIQLYTDEPLEEAIFVPDWKQAIAAALADLNDCVCFVTDRRVGERRLRRMCVGGRRSDFEVCEAMYRWIVERIDAMAQRSSHRLAHRRFAGRGLGRRWLESYRHGAASEVEQRLLDEMSSQRRQLAADPKAATALAIRHDAVTEWAKENVQQAEAAAREPVIDPEAFRLGAAFGRIVPLRPESSEPE